MLRLPRRSALVALAIGATVTLAGCSSPAEPTASPSASAVDTGPHFVLIAPTAVEPGTFLQHAVDGVTTASAKLGATLEILEPSASVTVQQNIDAAMLENPTVIIGVTDGVLTEFDYTAASNLAHQFLLIDAAALEPTGNLTAALFRDYEADYLVGVEAGALAEDRDSVAIVSPAATQFVEAQAVPFRRGATSREPKLAVAGANVGTLDQVSQQDVDVRARDFRAAGASIIQPIGFGPSTTLLAAAATEDFQTFGHHFDQCAVAPGHVIDSTINRVDVVAELALRDVIAGNTGITTSYGLADGGVSLASLDDADSGCLVLEHPKIVSVVERTRDAIIAGEIEVADPLYADPTLQPSPGP